MRSTSLSPPAARVGLTVVTGNGVFDGIATLALNNPKANAYDYDVMRDLDAAILEARMDESIHVIIIRGAGEKFFCAGADIKMLNAKTPHHFYYFSLHANETARRLETTPKLVIAEAGNFPDLARFYLDEVVHRGLALLRSVIRRGVASGDDPVTGNDGGARTQNNENRSGDAAYPRRGRNKHFSAPSKPVT